MMAAVLDMFVSAEGLAAGVLELVWREVGEVGRRAEVNGWDRAKVAKMVMARFGDDRPAGPGPRLSWPQHLLAAITAAVDAEANLNSNSSSLHSTQQSTPALALALHNARRTLPDSVLVPAVLAHLAQLQASPTEAGTAAAQRAWRLRRIAGAVLGAPGPGQACAFPLLEVAGRAWVAGELAWVAGRGVGGGAGAAAFAGGEWAGWVARRCEEDAQAVGRGEGEVDEFAARVEEGQEELKGVGEWWEGWEAGRRGE